MSTLQDILNINSQIKLLKTQILELENKKNDILNKFFNKHKTKIFKYTPYKNNSDILITKNDIECDNEIDISDYELSSEESTE